MDFAELKEKKVFGVPVLYLGLLAVVVFAVVAWKLKPTKTDPATGTENTTPDNVPGADEASLYSGFGATSNSPATSSVPTAPEVVQPTNDDWAKKSIEWLVAQNKAGGGEAQAAIVAYLNGEDLSFEQGQLRDDAIKQFGTPPEPLGVIGQTGMQQAQKQFTSFPGKHVVKNSNDHTAAQLATLYYGSAGPDFIALIEAQSGNNRYGTTGVYPVGATIGIPMPVQPKYFTAVKGVTSAAQIGGKNGVSSNTILVFNPTLRFPVKIGTKVRVA